MADMEKKLDSGSNAVDQVYLEKGAMEQFQESYQFTPEEEKKLVWKIDLMYAFSISCPLMSSANQHRILPIMLIAYMMAFLDKQTLSYTALMGLQEDLGLKGADYSWTSSIFYFGYLLFSWPASLLMVKFPLGKYLACNLCVSYTSYTSARHRLTPAVLYGPSSWPAMQRPRTSPASW